MISWKKIEPDFLYEEDGDANITFNLNSYWTKRLNEKGFYEIIWSEFRDELEANLKGKGGRWDEVYSEYLGSMYTFSEIVLGEKVAIFHVTLMEDEQTSTNEILIFDARNEIK